MSRETSPAHFAVIRVTRIILIASMLIAITGCGQETGTNEARGTLTPAQSEVFTHLENVTFLYETAVKNEYDSTDSFDDLVESVPAAIEIFVSPPDALVVGNNLTTRQVLTAVARRVDAADSQSVVLAERINRAFEESQ